MQDRQLQGAEAKLQRLGLDLDRVQGTLLEMPKEGDQLKAKVRRLGEELLRLRQHPMALAAAVHGRLREVLEILRESLEEERAKRSRTLAEKMFLDTDAVTYG